VTGAMTREGACLACGGVGTEYDETRLTCGGNDYESAADHCDGCRAPMQYARIRIPVFYACGECVGLALKALGTTHDHIALGARRARR